MSSDKIPKRILDEKNDIVYIYFLPFWILSDEFLVIRILESDENIQPQAV